MRKGIRWLAVTALAALGTLGGGLALSAAPAGAFSGYKSLGAFGSSTFTDVQSIAVEQSTGDVYVYDAGPESIYKFNAKGEPENFEALGTNVIAGVSGGGTGESELAVSSAGPTSGDIYFSSFKLGHVGIYAHNGEPVKVAGSPAELNSLVTSEVPGAPWSEVCGVTVDPAGNVYVGLYHPYVNRYEPKANPVVNKDYTGSLWGLSATCMLAADSEESVYVETEGVGVSKYGKAEFNTTETAATGTPVDASGTSTLAVDPSNNDVYIDEKSDIARYSSTGSPESRYVFGNLGGASYGVAVNGSTHEVYAPNSASPSKIEVFGPVELPTAITEAATNKQSTSATLNGKINTEGVKAEGIEFEYGLSTAYGTKVKATPEEVAAGEKPVEASVSGLEPHQTYHFRVVAYSGGVPSAGQDLTFETGELTPAVQGSVSNVSRTGALLEGTVNSENLKTEYHFVYVPASEYQPGAPNPYEKGLSSTPVTLEPEAKTVAVAPFVLSELHPGTTYHFALVASNEHGTTPPVDGTFTTKPPTPPTAVVLGAVGITQSTATLMGGLDPEELQTAYAFEIAGPAGQNGYEFSPVTHASANGGPQPISTELAYLAPATTYRYRIVAVNQDGSATSSEGVFTTGSYPAPPAETFQVFPDLSQFVEKEPPTPPACKKGYVRKNGKCVKKPKPKKHRKAKKKKKK